MNKPDSYIPFYAMDFWQAVKGLPDFIVVGYLKALTHYWFHEHCNGLKDNSQYLRKVCEIDMGEPWNEFESTIFDGDKYFKQDENGLWQQKRCREVWLESEKRYNKVMAASLAGVQARQRSLQRSLQRS